MNIDNYFCTLVRFTVYNQNKKAPEIIIIISIKLIIIMHKINNKSKILMNVFIIHKFIDITKQMKYDHPSEYIITSRSYYYGTIR